MNAFKLEQKMRESYDPIASEYRCADEVDAAGPDHQHLCRLLGRTLSLFDRKITILDAGCGTGRFFHCLKNVSKLVGIDLSPEMLAEAQKPVKTEDVCAQTVELITGNIYTVAFPPGSFDLIYSFGVFGNGCAVTDDLCNKFYEWLAPGGYLIFDTNDIKGETLATRLRMRTKNFAYSLLPKFLQDAWDEKSGWLPFFAMTSTGLERLMNSTQFKSFAVKSRPAQLTLGAGKKLQCIASKDSLVSPAVLLEDPVDKDNPGLIKKISSATAGIDKAMKSLLASTSMTFFEIPPVISPLLMTF